MTREDIRSFFDRRQAHWEARDAVALAHGHAEDGVVVSPMFGTHRGRSAILTLYTTMFATFPDWTFTSEDLLIDESRVAQPFTATATHVGMFMGLAGTNRRFRIQGVRLVEMGEGVIQHERRVYDFTGFLIQVGVLKGKPAV